jgi:hypothetical protein
MRRSLTDCLRELLARETRDGRTLADLIVEMVVMKALAGDIRFIRLIFDRIELPVARQAVDRVPAASWIVIEPPDSNKAESDRIPSALPLTPGGEPLTIDG